jgi:hypothetical protein
MMTSSDHQDPDRADVRPSVFHAADLDGPYDQAEALVNAAFADASVPGTTDRDIPVPEAARALLLIDDRLRTLATLASSLTDPADLRDIAHAALAEISLLLVLSDRVGRAQRGQISELIVDATRTQATAFDRAATPRR